MTYSSRTRTGMQQLILVALLMAIAFLGASGIMAAPAAEEATPVESTSLSGAAVPEGLMGDAGSRVKVPAAEETALPTSTT